MSLSHQLHHARDVQSDCHHFIEWILPANLHNATILLYCRSSQQNDITTSLFIVKVSYTVSGQGFNYEPTIWTPFLKWRTVICRTDPFVICLLHSCPQDSTVQYHSNGGLKGLHRFSLQTFKFVNAPDPFVYIHCKVTCAFNNRYLAVLRLFKFESSFFASSVFEIGFSYCAFIIYFFICWFVFSGSLLCLWEARWCHG